MNTFLPIQIIFLVFLIFALSRVFLRVREGNLTLGAFLFWLSLWILAIFSILNPEFTSHLAKVIGIGRGTDVVIYASIVILFYLIFRTNVMLENIRHEINKLSSLVAIKSINKKKSSKK